MKLLKAMFVFALALVVLAPFAFAETQNVKVSGSIDSYWFYRNNYDLRDNNDSGAIPQGSTVPTAGITGASLQHRTDSDNFFRTNTQVEVAADLTDNVSTVINLVNQRDWNANRFKSTSSPDLTITNGDSQANDEFDIELDLAYVKMKEIFYAPLTLTVGRQDLWFGRGFIIGNNNRSWDQQNVTVADEYSVTNAFDAARATLDFNPWTLDFVASKIDANNVNASDDIDLYIINVNYKFAEYNAVAEAYYVSEQDRGQVANASNGTKDNSTETLGIRGQFDPISQITLGGEVAWQFGDYRTAANLPSRDREAWALDLFGTYRFDSNWKPELTVEYVLFSGETDLSAGSTQSYGAWNGLYRGKFWTAYGDFREFVYATGDAGDTSAMTNQDMLQIKGSMKPLEDLLLEASFTYFWFDEAIHTTMNDPNSGSRSSEIGWEVDLQATYDYTEDVTFGVLAGWFVPGDFYQSGTGAGDATATDLVSSVKVSF